MKTSGLKVGFDFDGVIAQPNLEQQKRKAKLLEKATGVKLEPSLVRSPYVVDEMHIITMEEYDHLLTIIESAPDTGLMMEPLPKMSDYLPRILEVVHSGIIITGRPLETYIRAKEWWEQYKIKIEILRSKDPLDKRELCSDLDVYVDDTFKVLSNLVDIVPYRYLFDGIRNKNIDESNIAERVHSWKDLYYKKIKRIG